MLCVPGDRKPPADPWSIYLSYSHRRPWWFDADDDVQTWYISADVHDERGAAVSHVGDITIVLVDLDDTEDPAGLLDGEDADLGLIAGTIFDPTGGLTDELDELIEPFGSKVLILHSVTLTPEWRGFGLGALLAGTAIKTLSGGACAAICYPAPLGNRSDDPATRERQIDKLAQLWAHLGFEHYRNGVHVLHLNLTTLDENLTRLRHHAEQHQHDDADIPD